MNKTVDQICDDIINYYAGSGLPEDYSNSQREIIAASDRDWFNLDCDPEGPTKEQEKEQDLFLENVAKEVSNCK